MYIKYFQIIIKFGKELKSLSIFKRKKQDGKIY